MAQEEHNKIEKLQKELYSREFIQQSPGERTPFKEQEFDVKSGWKHDDYNLRQIEHSKPLVNSFFKKIFFGSLFFFILAAAVALYIVFRGYNIVSTDKINISFVGPVSIAAGEQAGFDVVVENNNSTPIENTAITVEYPDGTKKTDNITDLRREKFELGEILAKSNKRQPQVKAILYGEQHSVKEIKVTVEYQVKGSDAVFEKQKSYEITITSAPLTLAITNVSEAVSGDYIDFTATITSNSSTVLSNVLLKTDYPFGFYFVDATPKPNYDSSEWLIPTLKPGEKKTISLRSKVEGEELDERALRFTIGLQDKNNEKQIATAFLSTIKTVVLHRPPVAVKVEINGSASKEVAITQAGQVGVSIDLVNNMPLQLVDAEIIAKLGGTILDPSTVSGGAGTYRVSEKTITWTKSTLPELALVNPGQTTSVNFYFFTLTDEQLELLKKGQITISISVTGKQIKEGENPRTITTSVDRLVKIQSSADLVSRLVYSTGPFKNTGPIPPKVDTKTTYTVMWTITNSSNLISNSEVKAKLPPYVKWLGMVSPLTENVTLNSETNEVVWRVGDIPAGNNRVAREVAFQVEFFPSLSQFKTEPIILPDTILTGTDTFTNNAVSSTAKSITTTLSTDPKFTTQSGVVQR